MVSKQQVAGAAFYEAGSITAALLGNATPHWWGDQISALRTSPAPRKPVWSQAQHWAVTGERAWESLFSSLNALPQFLLLPLSLCPHFPCTQSRGTGHETGKLFLYGWYSEAFVTHFTPQVKYSLKGVNASSWWQGSLTFYPSFYWFPSTKSKKNEAKMFVCIW